MTAVYAFCLAAGAPLLLWFAFGGGDADGGGGDLDGDVDSDSVFALFSVSTLAFVVTFFGGTGLLATWLGAGAASAFVVAVIVGLAAGVLNRWVFAWLRRTEMSSEVSDRDLEGTIARVNLAVAANGRGRITLEVAGARTQMTAAATDGAAIAQGTQVIVVGVEGGVALVTPFGLPGEPGALPPPDTSERT